MNVVRKLAVCLSLIILLPVNGSAAQPSLPLDPVRQQIDAALANLYGAHDKAALHTGDVAEVAYRLNSQREYLDDDRARTDAAYLADQRLEASLNDSFIKAAISGTCPPVSTTPGIQETCFFSSSDKTLQPLAVYVPSGAAKDAPLSLVVMLRGRGQTETNLLSRHEVRALADETNTLIAAPYARGENNYDRVGVQDVFDVLGLVTNVQPFDRSHTYIAGFSMGGINAFHIAANRPNAFASVLSIAGALNGVDQDGMTAFRGRKVYLVNGGSDTVITPDVGRRSVLTLGRLGAEPAYYEPPSGIHSLTNLMPSVALAWRDMLAGSRTHATSISSSPPDMVQIPAIPLPPVLDR